MFTPLRARRAVFWYLGSDRIVAAVVARGEREPVLEACAASYSAAIDGSRFAPGLLEIAWVLGCEDQAHVAALAAPYCRLESIEGDARAALEGAVQLAGSAAAQPGGERVAAVRGADGLRVYADAVAVSQAAAMFRRARLRLVALDCEPCALASLADALGSGDAEGARRQHLSAVTVMPDSESSAEALGEDLAVPVGLAVAWFGAGRAL
ncbi:MAG: hypothetical protein ABR538_07490 [Candidatus Binatia bacterium]